MEQLSKRWAAQNEKSFLPAGAAETSDDDEPPGDAKPEGSGADLGADRAVGMPWDARTYACFVEEEAASDADESLDGPTSEHFPWAQTAVSEARSKRPVGRPKGTFGSAVVRDRMKKAAASAQPPSTHPKGSIEYARQFIKKGASASSAIATPATATAVKDTCGGAALAPNSPVWGLMENLGSPTQCALRLAAHQSMTEQQQWQRDTSDCAEVLSLKSSALMSNAAVQAALQSAGKQDIADVGRAAILGTSAAVLSGGLMWAGVLQLAYEKIDSGQWRGVMMLQKLRYDETPLRIRLTEAGTVASKDQEVSLLGKVLQFEASLHLLVQEARSGKHMLFSGKVPAVLQTVDRMTTECLLRAIERVEDCFPFCLSSSTLGFGVNLLLNLPPH